MSKTLTKDRFKSGDKLIFLQVHNILPIALALLWFVVLYIGGFIIIQKQERWNSQTHTFNIAQDKAIREDRAELIKLRTEVEELKKAVATPTPIRRITPVPAVRR